MEDTVDNALIENIAGWRIFKESKELQEITGRLPQRYFSKSVTYYI